MRFLKTLIWVTVIVGMVVFAVNNWVPASIKLWGGLWLDSKLPALMIGSFIAGFVPLYIWHRGAIWRMRRRIAHVESTMRPNSTSASVPASPSVFVPLTGNRQES
jgi:lipopolysaccharide assembly protein A